MTENAPNFFFLPREEQAAAIDQYIADGCNVMYLGSVNMLGFEGHFEERDRLVAKYPNVSWIVSTDVPLLQPESPPNLIEPGSSWYPKAFVAGAVVS